MPASLFPEEECEELGGQGWSAYAVNKGGGVVEVTFRFARDEQGRPFAPTLLRRSDLA